MAKAELGTKRTCPDTGKKFYDLNKDPIVSPYSGNSWPLSFFEETSVAKIMEKAEEEEVEEVDAESSDVEIVSLEDADDDSGSSSDDIPDIGDDDDVEIDDDDDDTFLATDDDEDEDDMTGIIGVSNEDEES